MYVECSKCLSINKHVLLRKPECKSKYKVQGRISLLLPFLRICAALLKHVIFTNFPLERWSLYSNNNDL